MKSIIIFLSLALTTAFLVSQSLYITSESSAIIAQQEIQQYHEGFTFSGPHTQMIHLLRGPVQIKVTTERPGKFYLLKADNTYVLELMPGLNIFDLPQTGPYLLDIKTNSKWSIEIY